MEAAAEANRIISATAAIRSSHSHMAEVAVVGRDSLNRDRLPQPVVKTHMQLVSSTPIFNSSQLMTLFRWWL